MPQCSSATAAADFAENRGAGDCDSRSRCSIPIPGKKSFSAGPGDVGQAAVQEPALQAGIILPFLYVANGSLHGLVRVAKSFASVRSHDNPDLDVLGVALFDFARQDTRILADTRERLVRNLAGAAPVFETVIRNARKASTDMRRDGLLAFEYEEAATTAMRQRVRDRVWESGEPSPNGYSKTASGLAEDYQSLTKEILAAYVERGSS